MADKIDTRAVGLDVGLAFIRWLTGAENLHYGLWTGLEATAGNLRAAQDAYTVKLFGYLPEDAVEYVGKALDIPAAELFGVATFYAMFRLQPQGKYVVRLCRGTACHVQGSGRIGEQLQRALDVQEGNTTVDGMFTLQYVACLGCCSLAPVMMVGEDVHGRLTPEKAVAVLETYRSRRVEP